MDRLLRLTLLLGALAWMVPQRSTYGGLFCHHHEGTPPPGSARVFDNTPERAGYPLCLSGHARPSNTPEYVGYHVGGGASCGGCPRRAEDGTWGWDYQGHWIPRHVGLPWSHGRLHQGGAGAYDPDGHHIPDVIGLTVSRLRNH